MKISTEKFDLKTDLKPESKRILIYLSFFWSYRHSNLRQKTQEVLFPCLNCHCWHIIIIIIIIHFTSLCIP